MINWGEKVMKGIICFFMLTATVFFLSIMETPAIDDTGSPKSVQLESAAPFTVRGGLPNVAAKLKSGETVNVVFLGGSITVGGASPKGYVTIVGYWLKEKQLTLFFHCAGEGKKLDIMKHCNNVCFEMDTSHKLLTGDTACEWSMNFESIIGNGQIFFETDKSKKLVALEAIMKHYGGENLSFDESIVARTTVLFIECTHFSGKRLNR